MRKDRLTCRTMVLLSVILITPDVASAGAWMRSGGEYLYSVGVSNSRASQYFDDDSSIQDTSCSSNDIYVDQHIEYGYSYYRTLFAGFSVAQKSCGDEQSFETGDLEVGLRGRIFPLRNGKSWEASLLIPTSSSSDDPSQLGVGRLGLKLGLYGRFEAGGTVRQQRYFSTGAEVRLWEGGISHRFRTYADYSWPWMMLTAKVGLLGDFSMRNGSEGSASVNQTAVDDYDKISAKASIKQKIGKWSLRYRLSRTIWGRNTDASTSLGISLSRSWQD